MRLLLIRFALASLLLLIAGSPGVADQAEQADANTITGKMFGKTFKPDHVELENRQLTIRQGDAFAPALRLSISFFDIGNGEIPEGKSYSINPGSQMMHNLVISSWQQEGDNGTHKMFRDGYRLRLSFGKEEKKGLLPGTIEFSMPGSPITAISGSFVAKVRGFRVINGKVDLTSDSHATLNEVALEYLRKKYPGKEVQVAEQRENVLVAPDSSRKWGYQNLAVTVAGKPVGRLKLLFTKQSGEWAVFSELTPQQFPHAHPVYPPADNDNDELIAIVSAQKAERDFLTAFPGKEVHSIQVISFEYEEGFGGAAFQYKVEGSEEVQERHYVLQLKDRQWEVIGEVAGQTEIIGEIKKLIMQKVIGKGCNSCRVKGVLMYDGKNITAVTPVQPTFWFVDEQNDIEVIPKLEYENGRFTISGLPPGEYGMSVHIDANLENLSTFPGDYETFIRFTVSEGESTLPDVNLAKLIHLTSPQDNGSEIEHSGEECSGDFALRNPVRFSWEPLDEGTSYDYEVTRFDCEPFEQLAVVAKGTTTETFVSVQLAKSSPGEFYMFRLNGRKNDTFTGMLTTRGAKGGYGWDYRFRVR